MSSAVEQIETPSSSLRRLKVLQGQIGLQETIHAAPIRASVTAMMKNNLGPQTLANERSRASFTPRLLTNVLDGGEEITKIREEIMQQLEEDPVFDNSKDYDLTRSEARVVAWKRVRAVWRLFMQDSGNLTKRNSRVELYTLYDRSWATRNGVHFGLFLGAVQSQGTDEQSSVWGSAALTMQINGCFGMTELGHGSYVRGIETTATFQPDTQEFVVNSPTDTSTKWWIGGAGQTATHCAVYARLLIGAEDKGVHTFIVPLRSMSDHSPLPGVTVGDCGAKMGRNGLDNGWIQFDNVRIPAANMLSRYAQVAADGTYSRPPKAQLAYGALIGGRASMVKDSSDVLKVALTIAIRYGAVRRQFSAGPGQPETQLLDYQSHQHRLFPLLATAYAFHFTAQYMQRLNDGLQSGLEVGDISALPDVHATSAGLKAQCTWYTHWAIDQCRQACGGHGYSKYAALSEMSADFAVMCTWEGDNTVMSQQTARYLLSSFKRMLQGEKLSGSVQYLERLPQGMETRVWAPSTAEQVLDPDAQLEAFCFLAGTGVQNVALSLKQAVARGMSEDEAWNDNQMDLLEVSAVHCFYNIALNFIAAVRRVQAQPTEQASVAPVLWRLCHLFVLQQLYSRRAAFLRLGYMTAAQVALIQQQQKACVAALRGDAVPLVDAFNFSDRIINSPLGCKDGDVYARYLDRVKAAPGCTERAPYWEEEIKPSMLVFGEAEL